MIELLRYLEANGFTVTSCPAVAGTSCARLPVCSTGFPPNAWSAARSVSTYRDTNLFTTAQPEFLDDGPMKPVRLWSRIGRRPILAAGNSNGDIEMLEFTRGMRLLVLHDDADREFDYTAGAEKALELAAKDGWTVVSVRNDWTTVFSDQ